MNYRLLINIMIVFTLLVGQVSIESTPKSFSLEQSIDIQTQTLPAFDIQKFIDEVKQIKRKELSVFKSGSNKDKPSLQTSRKQGSSSW